jgi:hypothetical protein
MINIDEWSIPIAVTRKQITTNAFFGASINTVPIPLLT